MGVTTYHQTYLGSFLSIEIVSQAQPQPGGASMGWNMGYILTINHLSLYIYIYMDCTMIYIQILYIYICMESPHFSQSSTKTWPQAFCSARPWRCRGSRSVSWTPAPSCALRRWRSSCCRRWATWRWHWPAEMAWEMPCVWCQASKPWTAIKTVNFKRQLNAV